LKASNLGIEKSRGKYIAIIDTGDIADKRRLEEQSDYLEVHQNIYVLGTQGRWIDDEKRPREFEDAPSGKRKRALQDRRNHSIPPP
jgi:hypothetical protein